MNETVDIMTGEVMPETAIATTDDIAAMVKPQDLPLLRVIQQMDSLDWKNLQPHQTAFLLTQKPYPVSGGGYTNLTFRQALLFAVRAFELGVSPFSGECWFNTSTSSVALTLEGKKTVARNKGIDLGPPSFEDTTREWSASAATIARMDEVKKLGFPKDVGVKCRIRVGPIDNKEYAEYSAFISEWLVTKSPVWISKPLHMLQTRAYEKAISLAMGTGASDPVD